MNVPFHVLLVHPDVAIADRIAAIVRRIGGELVHARSGEQAVDLFVRRPAEVIVVGLSLPGRDGARTVETLRWAPKGREARVILLTGRTPPHRVETAVRRIAPLATLSGERPDLWDLSNALRQALRPRSSLSSSMPPPEAPTRATPLDAVTADHHPEVRTATVRTTPPSAVIDPQSTPPPPATDGSGLKESQWVAERFASLQEAARLHGDMDDTPFPLVLARLAELRASGELVVDAAHDPRATLDGGPVRKVVFFRTGVPIGVRSNLLEERLGQLLLRQGRLREETLTTSLEEAHRTHRPHGGVLLSLGLLTPEELNDLLTEQFTLRLLDLFSWRAGSFRFAEGEVSRDAGTPLEMSLPQMLLRGVTEHMDARLALARMRRWLDNEVHPEPITLRSFEQAGALLLEPRLHALLDPRPRLRSLVSGSAERALLLYALWCGGAVHFREVGDVPPDPGPEAESSRLDASSDAPASTCPDAIHALTRVADPSDIEHSLRSGETRETSTSARLDAMHAPTRLVTPSEVTLDEEIERALRAEQLFRQGIHALERSETQRALEALDAVVRLCPRDGEFLAWRAYAKHLGGDPEQRAEALQEASEARALSPERPLTHLLHARMLLSEGQSASAREALEAVLRIDPDHPEALDTLKSLETA